MADKEIAGEKPDGKEPGGSGGNGTPFKEPRWRQRFPSISAYAVIGVILMGGISWVGARHPWTEKKVLTDLVAAFFWAVVFFFGMELLRYGTEAREKARVLVTELPLRAGLGVALLLLLARSVEWMSLVVNPADDSNGSGNSMFNMVFASDAAHVWASVTVHAVSALALSGIVLTLVTAILRLFREG